jgi:2-keto-4-pentenoate hydratase/2-oxohepta-3-ene-1,7-dioic acid hydratase in catechol pathway
VQDFGPSFFAGHGLARLAEVLATAWDDLPTVPDDQRVGPCVARPNKLLCIGLNYLDHAREAGVTDLPTEPIVFGKATNTVIGPNDVVLLPPGAEKVDWEVELSVVIGAEGRYLADEAAAEGIIAGYCVSNDISERAFQLERGGQWIKGKSCETFNPLGPWLVTPDEVDVGGLHLWTSVNGERVQDGTTADMIASAAEIVRYLSWFLVLEPGDVINTGTPAGVGAGFDPPRYLQEGDVVEVGIDGLGAQRSVCRRAEVRR